MRVPAIPLRALALPVLLAALPALFATTATNMVAAVSSVSSNLRPEGVSVPQSEPQETASNSDCITLVDVLKNLGFTNMNTTSVASNCCADPANAAYWSCENGNVTSITLNYQLLTGFISDSIGGLSQLRILQLRNNSLIGVIPSSIGALVQMQSLVLSSNRLNGTIPDAIGNLTRLNILDLSANQITGSIPNSIGNLTLLQQLDLSGNQISGSIPSSIGSLTQLIQLILPGNQISGSLPSSIGNLTLLQQLDLSANQISGSIPNSIGSLTLLQQLYLFGNQLNGSIPDSIGNLAELSYLYLSANRLNGPIPDSIGNLNKLAYLDLSGNELNGSIPDSMCNLSQLTSLDLSMNQISGRIPDSIGKLTQLQWLYLFENQLNGAVPESIGNLTALGYLDLFGNQLNGSVPDSIGNMTKLTYLNLNRNQFDGPIPDSIGNLNKLAFLDLSGNELNGSIPDSMCNLSQLNSLYLFGNQISGSIPSSIGNLTLLRQLDLSRNKISGSIPSSIWSLTQMQRLYLFENQLNGAVPESIGNLTALGYLDLSGNELNGSIPDSIGNLSQLTILNLNRNQFDGLIPDSIGNLNKLTYLDLFGNQLNGSVPDSIGNLSQLTILDLSANRLNGPIPGSIGNLNKLAFLDLSGNELNGSIPDSMCNLSQLNSLYLFGNQISGSIPSSIGNLTLLRQLDLSRNKISGSIPSSIWSLTQMQRLSLFENQLNGSVPDSIGSLIELSYLNISGNSIIGPIPSAIGNLILLLEMDLSHNMMSGAIPEALCSLNLPGSQLILNTPNDGNKWTPPVPDCILNNPIFIENATNSSSPSPLSSSISNTPSPSISNTPSPSISNTLSPSISNTPSPSISISPSISAAVSPSITPSASSSIKITPSISASITATISPSISASISLSAAPTLSITPSLTPSPSASFSTSPSISITPIPSNEPPEQAALAILKVLLPLTSDYNTDAYGTSNFCDTNDPEETGITCGSNLRIIAMNFTGGVKGGSLKSLESVLPVFTELQRLIIRNNPQFVVDLSACNFLGNMSSLVNLDLSDNQFALDQDGNFVIPNFLESMTNLRELRLSNILSINPIPIAMSWQAYLPDLVALDMQNMISNDSLFKSNMTSILSEMKNLQILILGVGHRSISSYIPERPLIQTSNSNRSFEWLRQLQNLTILDLNYLQADVSLPDDLFVSMPSLVYLDLAGVGLLYSPPSSIFTLSNLKYLNLQNNLLTSMAVNYNILSDLIYINLSGNLLSGTLPTSLLALSNLQYVDLSYNNFDGSFPLFSNSAKLKILSIANNSFSGSVPSPSSSSLSILYAAQNIFDCNSNYSSLPSAQLQFGVESFPVNQNSIINRITLPLSSSPTNATHRGWNWYQAILMNNAYAATTPATDFSAISNDHGCCPSLIDSDGSEWPSVTAYYSTSAVDGNWSQMISIPANPLTGRPVTQKAVQGQCKQQSYGFAFRDCLIMEDGHAQWQPRQLSCTPCSCPPYDGVCSTGENGDGTCLSCYNPLHNGSLCQDRIPITQVVQSVPSEPIRITSFSPIDKIDFHVNLLSVIFNAPIQLQEWSSNMTVLPPAFKVFQNSNQMLRQVIYSNDTTLARAAGRMLILSLSAATFNQVNEVYSIEIDANFVISAGNESSSFDGISRASNGGGLSWTLYTPPKFSADFNMNPNDVMLGSIQIDIPYVDDLNQRKQLFMNLSQDMAAAACISSSRIPMDYMNWTAAYPPLSSSSSIVTFQIQTAPNTGANGTGTEKSAVSASIDLQLLFAIKGSAAFQGSLGSHLKYFQTRELFGKTSLDVVSPQQGESISYAIAIFLAIVCIVYIILYFKNPKAVNTRAVRLMLTTYAFVTRWIFINSLLASGQYIMFAYIGIGLYAVVIPINYALSSGLLLSEWRLNEDFRNWWRIYRWTALPWIFLGGINAEIVTIMSSRICKLQMLSAKMSKNRERRLRLMGSIHVLLVDVPFFALQIYITVANTAGIPIFTLFALIGSSLVLLNRIIARMLLAVFIRFQAEHEKFLAMNRANSITRKGSKSNRG